MRGRSGLSVSRTSTCSTPPIGEVLTIKILRVRSGIKHLEEIKNAGFEMPAVNQIEVRTQHTSYRHGPQRSGSVPHG